VTVPAQYTPFDPLILQFVELKEWLLGSFGLSNDAMHINVGLALYLGMLLAFRGRGGLWLPMLLLTALSLLAEVFDLIYLWSVKSDYSYMESVRDVGCTLAWPLILSLLLGYWRRRGLPG
jgi:hypothetical protein